MTNEAICTFICTVSLFYGRSSNYPPEKVAVIRAGRDEAGGFEMLTADLTDACDSEDVFLFPAEPSTAEERF